MIMTYNDTPSNLIHQKPGLILLRGGGDLASGVALRLLRVGLRVVITELSQPLSVRRLVSFGEAVYQGYATVEGVTSRLVAGVPSALETLDRGEIPVLIDPDVEVRHQLAPLVIVDARMTKKRPALGMEAAPLVIGLGPGFVAGDNCHAAIETNRGHFLGRVMWKGAPQTDTGVPEAVSRRQEERVLRAPIAGVLNTLVDIGAHVEAEQLIAHVDGEGIAAPFPGTLRGLMHTGLAVTEGLKVGDLDPRDDPRFASMVSEKSLAIGGGVLEAILSRGDLRSYLWN
jgi:xanthine dehydrogenase accessory factor